MNDVLQVLQERFLLQKEFLGDEKPINKVQPLVSVSVPTYQHFRYISECLDGILMQQTSFPIEIIIGEDGSTDGTREICEKYAIKHQDKIRLFNRDRKLSQYVDKEGHVTRFNGIWNRMSARGKYIAICEGDDYWTDPLKLQKQVDFLESNPEFGMVYGKVYTWLQEENKFGKSFGKKAHTFEELVRYNTIPTLTVVLKYNLQQQYLDEIGPLTKNWKMGDYPMWLYISKVSKIGFIDEYLGTYRINTVSASHFKDRIGRLKFQMSALEIAAYMCNRFCVDTRLTNARLLWCNLEYASLTSDKELLVKVQNGIASISLWPISLRVIILKLLYKHPSMYLNIKKTVKSILYIP